MSARVRFTEPSRASISACISTICTCRTKMTPPPPPSLPEFGDNEQVWDGPLGCGRAPQAPSGGPGTERPVADLASPRRWPSSTGRTPPAASRPLTHNGHHLNWPRQPYGISGAGRGQVEDIAIKSKGSIIIITTTRGIRPAVTSTGLHSILLRFTAQPSVWCGALLVPVNVRRKKMQRLLWQPSYMAVRVGACIHRQT